jgi:galactokinase
LICSWNAPARNLAALARASDRGRLLAAATINLVACHQAESFMESIACQYEERTGHQIKLMVCQIVDGAT